MDFWGTDNFLINLDTSVFLFFNAYLTHPILDFIMTRITHLTFWIIPGLIAAAWFIKRERKKAFIVLGLIILTIIITDQTSTQFLKKFFARPRPCHPDFLVEGGRFLMGMRRSIVSFPSSHSGNMFALAMLLFNFYPRRAVYFFGFASMIAYSRVYIGVHYPIDILGGAVFGCTAGAGVYWGYKAICQKINASASRKIEEITVSKEDAPAPVETEST
ncbi:MAG: phosphatase PAP2 family protein [Chitinispirillia bacterium]|nr:phosphatase PAP2 family protein [Chitinispirillia bacterium]